MQCVQLPEGEFLKDLVQDMLKQLGAGGSSFPQQIVKMGMQGAKVSRSAACHMTYAETVFLQSPKGYSAYTSITQFSSVS